MPVEVVKKACLKPGRGSRSRLQYRSWAATCQRTVYLSTIYHVPAASSRFSSSVSFGGKKPIFHEIVTQVKARLNSPKPSLNKYQAQFASLPPDSFGFLRAGGAGMTGGFDRGTRYSVLEKRLAHCESAAAGVGSTIRPSHGHGCRALRDASLPDRNVAKMIPSLQR